MESKYEQMPLIDLSISEDGYQSIEIKDCEQSELRIHIDKRRNTSLFFTYSGKSNHLNVKISVDTDAKANILFWNETSMQLEMNTLILCGRNSEISIGYGDVSAAHAEYKITAQLMEEGAQCHITTAAFANHKHVSIEMKHTAAHTEGRMDNFAIVKEAGDYRMEASGIIQKGAHDSASHQATRGLTLSEKQKSEVVPILLIDENEVKASHATTLGQPDENQLYYLQSRGLNRQQALGLLTLGYLMPITKILQNEEIQKQLQEKIEEKVIRNV